MTPARAEPSFPLEAGHRRTAEGDEARLFSSTPAHLGFGGQDLVARVLARAGWTLSSRSVGRYRKERIIPVEPTPIPKPMTRSPRPVIARFVNHVWMMDLTQVRQFLGPELHVAAVFDAFSRAPFALQVFETRPGARDLARLLRTAARTFARPKYLITDLGGEFTGRAFTRTVRRIGAVHRFASADSLLATARLERFWRTLKESAGFYRLHLPLTVDDFEHSLALALVHYLCFRPHEGLGGGTPAEAFLGTEPAHRAAIEPPRGRPGEGPREVPFEISFLDPRSRRLPILTPAA